MTGRDGRYLVDGQQPLADALFEPDRLDRFSRRWITQRITVRTLRNLNAILAL
jgi:hypothetical protein